MKNKLKFGSREYRIDKFEDLINKIRGLIKKNTKV